LFCEFRAGTERARRASAVPARNSGPSSVGGTIAANRRAAGCRELEFSSVGVCVTRRGCAKGEGPRMPPRAFEESAHLWYLLRPSTGTMTPLAGSVQPSVGAGGCCHCRHRPSVYMCVLPAFGGGLPALRPRATILPGAMCASGTAPVRASSGQALPGQLSRAAHTCAPTEAVAGAAATESDASWIPNDQRICERLGAKGRR
jgi:hypothetical protein